MTKSTQFQFRADPEWLARVDRARGVESRSSFVRRVVEESLVGVPLSARVEAAATGSGLVPASELVKGPAPDWMDDPGPESESVPFLEDLPYG